LASVQTLFNLPGKHQDDLTSELYRLIVVTDGSQPAWCGQDNPVPDVFFFLREESTMIQTMEVLHYLMMAYPEYSIPIKDMSIDLDMSDVVLQTLMGRLAWSGWNLEKHKEPGKKMGYRLTKEHALCLRSWWKEWGPELEEIYKGYCKKGSRPYTSPRGIATQVEWLRSTCAERLNKKRIEEQRIKAAEEYRASLPSL
jgi:hypothetical protein